MPDKHLIAALCSRGRSIKERRLSKASLIQRIEKCLSHYSPLVRLSILVEEERDMKNLELQHFTQPQLGDLKILISQLSDMVNFAQMNLMSVLKS